MCALWVLALRGGSLAWSRKEANSFRKCGGLIILRMLTECATVRTFSAISLRSILIVTTICTGGSPKTDHCCVAWRGSAALNVGSTQRCLLSTSPKLTLMSARLLSPFQPRVFLGNLNGTWQPRDRLAQACRPMSRGIAPLRSRCETGTPMALPYALCFQFNHLFCVFRCHEARPCEDTIAGG